MAMHSVAILRFMASVIIGLIVYATNKICQPSRASRVPGSTGQDSPVKSLKIEDIQRPRLSSASESKESDEEELPKTRHAAERSALLRGGVLPLLLSTGGGEGNQPSLVPLLRFEIQGVALAA